MEEALEFRADFPVLFHRQSVPILFQTTDGLAIDSVGNMHIVESVVALFKRNLCVTEVESPVSGWRALSDDTSSDPDLCRQWNITSNRHLVTVPPVAHLVTGTSLLLILQVTDRSHRVEFVRDMLELHPAAVRGCEHKSGKECVCFFNTSMQAIVTGHDAIEAGLRTALLSDLAVGDAISIPIALMLMAAAMQSIRFLVIPIVTLPLTVLLSWSVVFGLSTLSTVSELAPNLMTVLSLALSVDYTLFMVTRWSAEVKAGIMPDEAVIAMLKSSGRVVVVSGLMLASVLLGMLLVPIAPLRSLGWAPALSVVCAVIIHVTVVPALLMWNPRAFFTAVTVANIDDDDKLIGSPSVAILPNQWHRFATAVTQGYRPMLAFGACAILAGFLAKRSVSVNIVGGDSCFWDKSSAVVRAYTDAAHAFGYDRLEPYVLVFRANTTEHCGFAAAAARRFFDSAGIRDRNVHTDAATLCKNQLETPHLRFSGDTMMMSVEFGLNGSAFSADGITWLPMGRAALVDACNELPLVCTLASANRNSQTSVIDTISVVFDRIPSIAAYMAGVVFLSAFAAFGSVAIAIKTVAMIFITVAVVFGAVSSVYPDGICWLVPLPTIAVTVGISLDYSIFLLSAIFEKRTTGATDIDSIIAGVSSTGVTISAAAVIMAVSFVGTLASHEAVLFQLSFIVIVSVLFDALVVRAILVPATMSLVGSYNWWPRRMPHSIVG